MKRVLAPVALVVVLIFAGCVSQPGDTQSGTNRLAKGGKGGIPSLPSGPQFFAMLPDGSLADPSRYTEMPPLVGQQRLIGHAALEPTLGINMKTGSIVYAAAQFGGPGALQGQPVTTVLRSKDQGVTWKDVTAMLPAGGYKNPPASSDPFIFVDRDTGRIFNIDLQALVCSTLLISDNEGDSWMNAPDGCGLPPGVHDHQSLATGKPRVLTTVGYPNLVYYCVNRVGDSSCATSQNGGLTFGPLAPAFPGVDAEAGGFCGGLTGHIKTDHAGRAFLPKGQCGVPSVAYTENDGLTWTASVISRSAGMNGGDHEVAIAADKDDNLYAFWIGTNGLPYLAISKDHARTWSAARNVAPPGVTATSWPTIYANDAGKVAFAYVGTTWEGGYAKNKNATAWIGATWNGYMGVMTDALAPDAIVFTQLVNDPADPLAINQCGGTRCNGLYDFIDISIDPSGRPWAALVDVCFQKCIDDFAKDPKSAKFDKVEGFVGTLVSGPALTAAGGALPALPELTVSTPQQG